MSENKSSDKSLTVQYVCGLMQLLDAYLVGYLCNDTGIKTVLAQFESEGIDDILTIQGEPQIQMAIKAVLKTLSDLCQPCSTNGFVSKTQIRLLTESKLAVSIILLHPPSLQELDQCITGLLVAHDGWSVRRLLRAFCLLFSSDYIFSVLVSVLCWKTPSGIWEDLLELFFESSSQSNVPPETIEERMIEIINTILQQELNSKVAVLFGCKVARIINAPEYVEQLELLRVKRKVCDCIRKRSWHQVEVYLTNNMMIQHAINMCKYLEVKPDVESIAQFPRSKLMRHFQVELELVPEDMFLTFPQNVEVVIVHDIASIILAEAYLLSDGLHWVGVDVEWPPSLPGSKHAGCRCASILQIALANIVFIFDMSMLASLPWNEIRRCDSMLTVLFRSIDIVKLGTDFCNSEDIARLRSTHPGFTFSLVINSYCDIQILFEIFTGIGMHRLKSLSHLCRLCLGKPLNKSEQMSDWSKRPLSYSQIQYAAMDAHTLLAVAEVLLWNHLQAVNPHHGGESFDLLCLHVMSCYCDSIADGKLLYSVDSSVLIKTKIDWSSVFCKLFSIHTNVVKVYTKFPPFFRRSGVALPALRDHSTISTVLSNIFSGILINNTRVMTLKFISSSSLNGYVLLKRASSGSSDLLDASLHWPGNTAAPSDGSCDSMLPIETVQCATTLMSEVIIELVVVEGIFVQVLAVLIGRNRVIDFEKIAWNSNIERSKLRHATPNEYSNDGIVSTLLNCVGIYIDASLEPEKQVVLEVASSAEYDASLLLSISLFAFRQLFGNICTKDCSKSLCIPQDSIPQYIGATSEFYSAHPPRRDATTYTYLCDYMFGRICKWLRLLGCDAITGNSGILDIDRTISYEHRIILTNNNDIQQRCISKQQKSSCTLSNEPILLERANVVVLEANDSDSQLYELQRKLNIFFHFETFMSRCAKCNGNQMKEIHRTAAAHRNILPNILIKAKKFWVCQNCDHLYWDGPKSQSGSFLKKFCSHE